MKNIKLSLTIFILNFCTFQVNAQCEKEISTNPNNPKNDEIMLPPSWNANISINPWLNTFNIGSNNGGNFNGIFLNPYAGWSVPSYTGASPWAMNNPFSGQMMSPQYDYLYQPNPGLANSKDWHWENGWELLWLNTGYFPNGERVDVANVSRYISGITGLANTSTPYIILYNRYNRQMRVLANLYADLNSFDNIKMNLGYAPGATTISGIFRGVGNYDVPLDQKTDTKIISTFNANPHNNNMWFSSDFKMAFDPCICQFIQDPISFDMTGFNVMDVNLTGRAISQNVALMDPVTKKPTYQDFLTNTGSDINDGQSSILYKNMDAMFADYYKELNDYNTTLNDYNSASNTMKRMLVGLLKDGITSGTTSGISALLTNSTVKKFLYKEAKSLGFRSDTNTVDGLIKSIQEGAKSFLPKEYDKLSIQLFGSNAMVEPQAPTMPTANFTEMKIKGTISSQHNVYISNLLTPGVGDENNNVNNVNNMTLNAFNYPAYNKALGLFAVLKTPKIEAAQDDNLTYYFDRALAQVTYRDRATGLPVPTANYTNHYFIDSTYNLRAYTVKDFIFKLKNPIQYRFNHNVDFNFAKTKLYALYEVEIEDKDLDAVPSSVLANYSFYSYNETNFELLHQYQINAVSKNKKYIFTTSWYPINDFGERYFKIKIENSTNVSIKTETGADNNGNAPTTYLGTNILQPAFAQNSNFDVANSVEMKFVIKKVKMKIMTDCYFIGKTYDNKEINTTELYTYLIYDKDRGDEPLVNMWTSGGNKYKTGIVSLTGEITTSNYNVSSIDHVTNTIYINAERVKIFGNVSAQAGYKLVVNSVEDIEIDPTTTISPEVTLRIKADYFSFPQTHEASDPELLAFCGTPTHPKEYKANTAAQAPIYANNTIPVSVTKQKEYIHLTLVPNPATQSINLVFNTLDETQGSLFVYDITGHLIKTVFNNRPLIKGDHNIGTDISDLAAGEYIVRLITTEGVQTAKLVKIGQ